MQPACTLVEVPERCVSYKRTSVLGRIACQGQGRICRDGAESRISRNGVESGVSRKGSESGVSGDGAEGRLAWCLKPMSSHAGRASSRRTDPRA